MTCRPSGASHVPAFGTLGYLAILLIVSLGVLAPTDLALAGGVGIERAEFLTDEGETVEMTVFYPSEVPLSSTVVGLRDVTGRVGAELKFGRFPLILISHDSRGDMLSHHGMASHLAMRGFVVAAVQHSMENKANTAGGGAYVRARQISAAIDFLIKDNIGIGIDVEQIGIVGHGAGSITALVLAGAVPDLGRATHCAQRDGIGELCFNTEPTALPQFHLPPRDQRIRAALLFAPHGSAFPDEPLPVAIPVGIIAAQSERAFPIETNVAPLSDNLPLLTFVEIIPLANSNIFLAPCGARQTGRGNDECVDPPMVDRQREHAFINDYAIAFFTYGFRIEYSHQAETEN